MERRITVNVDCLSKSLLIGPTNPLTKHFCTRMEDTDTAHTCAPPLAQIQTFTSTHTQLHTTYSAVWPVSQRCVQSINQMASMPINTVSEANAQNTDRRDRMLFWGTEEGRRGGRRNISVGIWYISPHHHQPWMWLDALVLDNNH